jgi:hypothetical protein
VTTNATNGEPIRRKRLGVGGGFTQYGGRSVHALRPFVSTDRRHRGSQRPAVACEGRKAACRSNVAPQAAVAAHVVARFDLKLPRRSAIARTGGGWPQAGELSCFRRASGIGFRDIFR